MQFSQETQFSQSLTGEIAINFDRPFNPILINATIVPEVTGTWQATDPIVGTTLYRSLTFVPDSSFLPNQNYDVLIEELRPAIGLTPPASVVVSFKTSDLPSVIASNLTDHSLPACKPIVVTFNQAISLDLLNISLLPATDLNLEISQDKKSVEITTPGCLEQSRDYELKVLADVPRDSSLDPDLLAQKFETYDFTKEFRTSDPPAIELIQPDRTNVLVDQKQLVLKFGEPMETDKIIDSLSISPPIRGEWNWQDDSTLVFQVQEKLAFDQLYTISLVGDFSTQTGSYIRGSHDRRFQTIGRVGVSSFKPRNGTTGVSTSTDISITFNQPVNQESAESRFGIFPQVTGTFSWTANTLHFYPENLIAGSSYTVLIGAGVGSINGLPSNQDFRASFRTTEPVVILDVPFDRQDYPLSCEASTLVMALGYYGISVSEPEIMSVIGYDGPSERQGDLWGDPNKAYVGDLNGHQNSTGYGVHWGPIARAANHWRPATAFSGWSEGQLASAIEAGHPVIIWGTLGGRPDSWETPTGGRVSTWVGEHTWVVVGFAGTSANPSAFYLHNPLGGRAMRWSKDQLIGNWNSFGRSGVEVK